MTASSVNDVHRHTAACMIATHGRRRRRRRALIGGTTLVARARRHPELARR